MRTIKFRGKRIDNKEWVYGYLYKLPLPNGEACMILTQDNIHLDNSLEPKYDLDFTLWVDLFLVDPATVGQFTGLFDEDGREIYEGDIIKIVEEFDDENVYTRNGVVCFAEGIFGLKDKNGKHFTYLGWLMHDEFITMLEVIGNIHDNPDLIEKGGEQ